MVENARIAATDPIEAVGEHQAPAVKRPDVFYGGFEAVKAYLPRLRYAHRAANLRAVETIVGPPATASYVELTARRAKPGIPEGLVRYSVGIEDIDDLLADLQQALG